MYYARMCVFTYIMSRGAGDDDRVYASLQDYLIVTIGKPLNRSHIHEDHPEIPKSGETKTQQR